MKIIVLGGGPGGLYCSLLLKKANPALDITVIERNPFNATYGWGVVFSDRTLASFREADYPTFKEITDQFVLWEAIDIWYRNERIQCGGHIFTGMSRRVLLNILQNRCRELDVMVKFETDIIEVKTLTENGDYDLFIAADGVNSLTRKVYADVFKPNLEVGKAKFVWFGTDKVFDAFTFIFRENEHGLFQAHAYPFEGTTSTFIIECEEETWLRAGLDKMDEAANIAYCQKLFADNLGHHRLLSNRSLWVNFATVKNKTWHHGKIVLLGDAAHTAHFSIGSGTKLAMDGAIAFANAFEQHPNNLEAALNDYELERRPRVEGLQEAAKVSQAYFEEVKKYLHLEPMQFAFYLLTRSGRISYDNLRLRDPYFVDTIDRWFAASSAMSGAPAQASHSFSLLEAGVAPPPMFNSLQMRGMSLPNRVVLSPAPTYSANEGLPNETHLAQLKRRALSGAALVMTELAAVSPEGRITPGCAGLYSAEHATAWTRMVELIHTTSSAKAALQLAHAGPRGSTRPRLAGLDRPLPAGNWPLLSASAIPYTPISQIPKAMDRTDMDKVCDDFVRAADMGNTAGFDLLQLHFGHGYLLATFISPLTNKRDDAYGGSLENRMRFPLEIFEAVRAVWPKDKPISVAFSATDWVKGGLSDAEATAVAGLFKAHGCDLIEVLAGQTTLAAKPTYDPGFLTPLSDRIRNEAEIKTMVAGNLTTTGEVNSILASGRADLCIMSPLHIAS